MSINLHALFALCSIVSEVIHKGYSARPKRQSVCELLQTDESTIWPTVAGEPMTAAVATTKFGFFLVLSPQMFSRILLCRTSVSFSFSIEEASKESFQMKRDIIILWQFSIGVVRKGVFT